MPGWVQADPDVVLWLISVLVTRPGGPDAHREPAGPAEPLHSAHIRAV